MNALENKIPPPIIAILFGLIMWLISISLPAPTPNDSSRWISIIILILLGNVFSLGGVMAFRRAKTTLNPLKPDSASAFVCSGIFQFSRNPMYVGMALYLLAWAIYLYSFFTSIGIFGFIIYIHRFQIQPEERALYKLFGDEYINYTAKVRPWL